ncbi:hypothetical protein BDV98DRAFT_654629 [Pterulicium gracile]|uniref:Uncharacterized protein n=1 Tax=Pterulicium gracile TaxID=1884261 RepID=A0A5C3QQF7_9AGAR|nr:hypothetical protein BDV98DRAFT_654629 [Pterula gracilis]
MPRRPLRLVLLLLCTTWAIGQDFTVPTTWRKPEVTLSVDERIQYATGAIDLAITTVGENGLVTGCTEQANKVQKPGGALARGGAASKAWVLRSVIPNPKLILSFSLNFGIPYGMAALKAYETYGDQIFLSYAELSWETGNMFTLSEAEVNAGKSLVKEFDLSKECSGISMKGGTFWQTTPDDGQLFGPSTGYFFVASTLTPRRLSSYLAKVTSNATYLDAANSSENFIRSHLLNRNDRLQASVSAKRTDSCSTGFFGSASDLDNTGLYIEGLSILNSISHSEDRLDLVRNVLHTATTNASYIRDDGVLSVGEGRTGSLPFVRALGSLYSTNTTYSDLRNYLKSFLGTQVNSLREQATSGTSNIYAGSWTGPPAGTLDVLNQVVAVSPLVESVTLQDQNPPSPDDPPAGESPGEDDPQDDSSFPIGAVVGGVVGGLAVIAVLLFFLYRRRRQRRRKGTGSDEYLHRPRRASRISLSAVGASRGGSELEGPTAIPFDPYQQYTDSDHSTGQSGYYTNHDPSHGTHPSLSSGYRGQDPFVGGTAGMGSSHQSAQDPFASGSSGTGSNDQPAHSVQQSHRAPLTLHGQAAPMSEKRAATAAALAAQQRSQQERRTGGASVAHTSTSDPSAASSSQSDRRAAEIEASDIPTEELVRLLNERLQADTYRDDDAPPPEYDAGGMDQRR